MWSQESSVTRNTPQKRNQTLRGRQNIVKRPPPPAGENYHNIGQKTRPRKHYTGLGAFLVLLSGRLTENSPESLRAESRALRQRSASMRKSPYSIGHSSPLGKSRMGI